MLICHWIFEITDELMYKIVSFRFVSVIQKIFERRRENPFLRP